MSLLCALWLSAHGAHATSDPLTTNDGAPASLSVMFLGSSLSAALPASVLQDRISICTHQRTTVSIIAAGGQTSLWGEQQLERIVPLSPQMIFVEFAINDADLRRGVSLSESARAHSVIVRRLKSALPDAKIVLLRLNRAYGLRAALRPRQAAYDQILPRLANETSADYLDLQFDWSAARRDLLPDGLHPTPQATLTFTVPALVRTIASAVAPDARCS